jgi:hypothetical protein
MHSQSGEAGRNSEAFGNSIFAACGRALFRYKVPETGGSRKEYQVYIFRELGWDLGA